MVCKEKWENNISIYFQQIYFFTHFFDARIHRFFALQTNSGMSEQTAMASLANMWLPSATGAYCVTCVCCAVVPSAHLSEPQNIYNARCASIECDLLLFYLRKRTTADIWFVYLRRLTVYFGTHQHMISYRHSLRAIFSLFCFCYWVSMLLSIQLISYQLHVHHKKWRNGRAYIYY